MNMRLASIIIAALLLTAGLATPTTMLAKGKPVKEILVDEAIPNLAEQGQTGLTMVLKGQNFPEQAKVTFYLTGQAQVGEITASNVVSVSSREIRLVADVADSAEVDDYDIEVEELATGRKGKGTAVFKVQAKGSVKETYNCDQFAPMGTCDCQFTIPGDGEGILNLLGDCSTSETLKLGRIVSPTTATPGRITAKPCDGNLNGQTVNGDLPYVCTTNGSFHGNTVFSNTTDGTSVRNIEVVFDSVARGCNAGDIHTVARFVLDENLEYDNPEGNTFFRITGMVVDSSDDALCEVFVLERLASFSPPGPALKDWKIGAINNVIASGSYELTGIRIEGFRPQEKINPIKAEQNTVGGPSCGTADVAVGIQLGSLLESDPGVILEGSVINNVIETGNCADKTETGILISGANGGTSVDVVKNTIRDAHIGIKAESGVVDLNLTGNNLYGDSSDTSDTAVCSNADSTNDVGKPGRVRNYANDRQIGDC